MPARRLQARRPRWAGDPWCGSRLAASALGPCESNGARCAPQQRPERERRAGDAVPRRVAVGAAREERHAAGPPRPQCRREAEEGESPCLPGQGSGSARRPSSGASILWCVFLARGSSYCREVSSRPTRPRPVLPAPSGSVVPAFVAGCEAILPIVKNGKPIVVLKINRVRTVVRRARHRAQRRPTRKEGVAVHIANGSATPSPAERRAHGWAGVRGGVGLSCWACVSSLHSRRESRGVATLLIDRFIASV
jgi:hypothetical protein